jgi:class 3 adenylate cyclase/tetratricopeptide (TPR) repeat protein
MPGYFETGTLDCYVPRVVLGRLATRPDERALRAEGTAVFVDISGFTRLSERLARLGPEGAEHLVEAINRCFSALLADAYVNGGGLLKFGGDALLLWFEGEDHVTRACASAWAMRSTLRSVGRIRTAASQIVLRMSVGIHTGSFDTFLVGGSHREYVIGGPATSTVVRMEAAASAGQILVSNQTARGLPRRALGSVCEPGVLLARSPAPRPFAPREPFSRPSDEAVARCLSTAVRAYVTSGEAAPEHRTATVAFVQFGGLDGLIGRHGPQSAAADLDALVQAVQEAVDLFQICFLGSDVAENGGKLILTAGAPRTLGDDEERMLLALRHIVESSPALAVRIGANRGRVFAGEIGPSYRRTYTVMGDTVNLAARLMAGAPWGSVYATAGVFERSQTKFETVAIPPFLVKGKARPVQAWDVGPIRRPVTPRTRRNRMPLIGRTTELMTLRRAISDARAGLGSMIELVGETGSGKSRLLSEARELATGFSLVHATCEVYTQNIPYVAWRDPLRQLLGLTWEDSDQTVVERLRSHIEAASQPDLLPWLPLLAIAAGADAPATREVEELVPSARAKKLHEAVLALLAPALATPTLVQIEHAHLMDEASAALLRALSKALPSSSWLVVATRRDVQGAFVASHGRAIRLELGALPREDALAFAEATPEAELLPRDLINEAVDRSGGSPEFLLDLLAAAASGSGELPDSVDAAASARLDALPPGDRALVRRAAVLGLAFHPRRLEHVLAAGAARPDAAMWLRLRSVFTRDPDGHVRFKRPALREVAYETLPFRLRRELHGAVAEALERAQGDDVDADPAVLSLHFILAGDHERAWRYARTAADRAVAKFAQADAANLYRRAIDAGRQDGASRAELAQCWEALGEALMHSGHSAAAVDALTAARNLVTDDSSAQARLLLRHVRVAHRQGRLTAAVRWGARGLRVLGDADDSESRIIRARLLAELAFVRYMQGRPSEAERLCRTTIEQFQADVDQRPLAHASYVLDLALVDLGRSDEAVYASRALAIYEQLGDLEEQGHVLNTLAMLAHSRWQWEKALALYARAGEAYERAGSEGGIAVAACNIGEILSDRGLRERAAQHLGRARRTWSANGERAAAAYAAVLLGRVAARGGMIHEARRLVSDAAVELRTLGETQDLELAEIVLAEAEALAGDASRAAASADRLLASSRELPWLKRVRAVALVRLGKLDAAMDDLGNSLAIARERCALYDVAATLDVLRALGVESPEGSAERDTILARLGIERLPGLEFSAPGGIRTPASSR